MQASTGGPVAQRRAGKEGAGTQGRIYKGRHSGSSLLRSAESAAGTVGEEGGSRKGERQTAVTSAVQELGYLFIRYPFSSPFPNLFLLPPLFFFFYFLRDENPRKGGGFLSFLFIFPPLPSLPHLPLLRLFPLNLGRSFPVAAPTGSEHLSGGGAGFL